MELKTEIKRFLDTLDRSPRTISTYENALKQFMYVVGEDVELTPENYSKFLTAFKSASPSTKNTYGSAVRKFYKFCKAGHAEEIRDITEHFTRQKGKRFVTFNREAVEKVIAYCTQLDGGLEALRDRAFVLTLVDTGLRISEACALKRGDIDWMEARAIIIGKGDKQAVVRFSKRSMEALKAYLHARSVVDPNSRIPLGSQPLFARHDIRASKKIRPITAGGMWKAIKGSPSQGIIGRIEEAGVDRTLVRIHDFRHYFVTMTYLAKGDLKMSQILARHESIVTTNRYAHLNTEADKAYDEIFNGRNDEKDVDN
jgi:integrase/recombinase XerC